ncbi:ZinT family metal-binding protein [Roseibium algae]|uniref:Metal-binding protein ZinT n=1 Tax=Roseibium algae TaxID=3123038 RepID=A0ABU8TQ27_9HYPH
MQTAFFKSIGALAMGTFLILAPQAHAQSTKSTTEASSHKHASNDIYKGIFENDQIKARTLADWEGDWQSVYPYLQDGTLAPVMEHKAVHGKKTAEEYSAYYDIGYKTNVNRIVIGDEDITFYEDGKATKGTYVGDGFEILTYKSGNRGVRYIFKKTAGDAGAPDFIQFSDHRIAPDKADHYHLYWGNDRAGLLKEVTNWPTYYPSALDGKEIVHQMTAH